MKKALSQHETQPKLMTFYDSLQSHFTKVYFVLPYMGQNIQE